jgi:hypothetical protein
MSSEAADRVHDAIVHRLEQESGEFVTDVLYARSIKS